MNSKWVKPENEARIIAAAKNNKSIAGMCRELGLAPRGGNIRTMRQHIVRLGIDVCLETGKGWNKENYSSPRPYQAKATVRNRTLRKRGHVCWVCGLSEWMGKEIPLDLDHIDGNNQNDSEDNLRMLCLNCHGQTPTFRNKKRTNLAPVSQPAEEIGSNPM